MIKILKYNKYLSSFIKLTSSSSSSSSSFILSNNIQYINMKRKFSSSPIINLESIDIDNNIKKELNLKVLKIECNRKYLRAFKKLSKANEKLELARQENDISNDAITNLENELLISQDIYRNIKLLQDGLQLIKSTKDKEFLPLAFLASKIGVNDYITVTNHEIRGTKKPKGFNPPPRKPYFVFKSIDGIDIRVGRGACDNDELSCNIDYRDNDNWWLHASGYPGSHVVIRYTGDDLIEKYKQTLIDGAFLAGINSKSPQTNRVQITYTRCKYVSKMAGSKPGMVLLHGEISSIKVDLKGDKSRITRLNNSKEII